MSGLDTSLALKEVARVQQVLAGIARLSSGLQGGLLKCMKIRSRETAL